MRRISQVFETQEGGKMRRLSAIFARRASYTGDNTEKPSTVYSKLGLLLIDIDSGSLEMLRFNVDFSQEAVSFLMDQITESSKDPVLRNLKYRCVISRDGKKLDNSKLLQTYYSADNSGFNVAIAVPEGVNSSKCTAVAKSVFSDVTLVSKLFNTYEEEILAESGILDTLQAEMDPSLRFDSEEEGSQN